MLFDLFNDRCSELLNTHGQQFEIATIVLISEKAIALMLS